MRPPQASASPAELFEWARRVRETARAVSASATETRERSRAICVRSQALAAKIQNGERPEPAAKLAQ